MSVLVWNQLGAGSGLYARRRQPAASVAEALLGRARLENITGRSQIFFGDIPLTSADCLLSIPQIGCPGQFQGELARKRRVAAEMTCPQRPTKRLTGRRIRGCDVFG